MSVDDPPGAPNGCNSPRVCGDSNTSRPTKPLDQAPKFTNSRAISRYFEIEWLKQQATITALERELEATRQSKRAVIEQYERILTDRTCDCEQSDARRGHSGLRWYFRQRS